MADLPALAGPAARRRPPPQRRTARLATALAGAAALLLLASSPGAGPLEALSLFGKGKRVRLKEKVLVTYRDYELKFLPRGPGKGLAAAIPRLRLQKIPPKPVSFTSLSGSVEGTLDKKLMTFPFTTQNNAAVQVAFPRIGGRLRLSVEDPPASLDLDDASTTGEASYEQRVPGMGDLAFKARTNGEWVVNLAREVEDLGRLRASVNSQLDWSADLEQTYRDFKGVVPTLTYGATQDGMRIRARLAGILEPGLSGSYTLENLPGKYAPVDFLHEAHVAATTRGGRHTLEAEGLYDRRLSRMPVRGSLSYIVRTRPATLEASVDLDRYRLKGRTKYGQVSAAIGRKADLGPGQGVLGRPAELEVKVGKVAAAAKFREGKPRVRLDVAV